MVSESSPSKRATRGHGSPTKANDDAPMATEVFEKLQKSVGKAQLAVARDDEDWNIVSVKWLDQAKKYVSEGGVNKTAHPGPIDNSQLIESEDGGNYLKDDLIEKVDYDFIPHFLWEQFVEVFGCEGGEEKQSIPAKAYEGVTLETHLEKQPLVVECVKFPDVDDVKRIRASRTWPVEQCIKVLLEKFGLPGKTDYRLWIFDPDGHFELPSISEAEKVGLLGLTTKHIAVLEVKEDSLFALGETDGKDSKVHREYVAKLREKRGLPAELEEPQDKQKKYNLRSQDNSQAESSSWSLFGYRKGKSEPSGTPGLSGLMNLGNTCFMNSSLQCMSNVPELTDFFLTKNFQADLNLENPLGKKGEIANAYAGLVSDMWSGRGPSVTPSKFKQALGRYSHLFSGAQQDSQESLQYIIDCLHEDLNRVRQKPYIEQKEADSKLSEQEASEQAWRDYLARDNSKVVDLFAGQIRSIVRCPDCKKISTTFDPVFYYSLPLPSTQTKKIGYVLVTYSGAMESLKKVSVLKTSTVEDFLKKVGEEQAFPIASKFFVAVDLTSNDKKVHSVLKRDAPVEDLSRGQIVVYQLPYAWDDEKFMPVFVHLRKLSTYGGSSGTLIDYPIAVCVPRSGLSPKRLYSLVYFRLAKRLIDTERFVSGDAEAGTADENDENVANGTRLDNGGDSDMADASEPVDVEMESDIANESENELKNHLPASKLFSLVFVNSFGTHELEQIKSDSRKMVKFSKNQDNFIAANFPQDVVSTCYRTDNPSDPFADSSSYSDRWGRDKSAETVKLEDCFGLYITAEKLGGANMWRCPDCKEEKPAVKKLDFWKLPEYMFVHLKRFQYNRFYREKLSTRVKIPVDDLDISDIVINPKERPAAYELIAMSCHSGGLGSGHYWAVCKNHLDGKWYKFDDSYVSAASDNDVNNESSPYILVYRRKGGPKDTAVKSEPVEGMDATDSEEK